MSIPFPSSILSLRTPSPLPSAPIIPVWEELKQPRRSPGGILTPQPNLSLGKESPGPWLHPQPPSRDWVETTWEAGAAFNGEPPIPSTFPTPSHSLCSPKRVPQPLLTCLGVDLWREVTRWRSWREGVIAVGDERCQRVYVMGVLHHRDLVGLWGECVAEDLQPPSRNTPMGSRAASPQVPHPWNRCRQLGATWFSGKCPCPGQNCDTLVFKSPSSPNHSEIP